MKTILVFDKPNACWECMLCGGGIKERFCIARIYEQGNTNDCDIKDLNKVESWCPLKPLPKKKETMNAIQYSGLAEEYRKEGWNECIDEITGEEE